MAEPSPPKPRVLVGSILSAGVVGWSMIWIGFVSHRFVEVFQSAKVPMPALTLLLVSVPQAVWWTGGVLSAAGLIAKDFWVDEKRSFALNAVILPLACLFLIACHQILMLPLLSVLEGLKR